MYDLETWKCARDLLVPSMLVSKYQFFSIDTARQWGCEGEGEREEETPKYTVFETHVKGWHSEPMLLRSFLYRHSFASQHAPNRNISANGRVSSFLVGQGFSLSFRTQPT